MNDLTLCNNDYPVVRKSYPLISSFDENPLTTIARQEPMEVLNYLERSRRDNLEIAKINAKMEVSKTALNELSSMGCQFLSNRTADEKHCCISVDTCISNSFGESFFGGRTRVKGKVQIDIW